MRVLLISNPNSTSLNGEVPREVVPALMEATELISCFTEYAGHAEDIARGLTREDADVVIIMGGDGSVNEVINGLLGPDVENRPAPEELPRLAVIPSGSAHVFARALGFPNDPGAAARKLAGLLSSGTTRRLPVGRVAGRWFIVNVGFGLDAAVIKGMEKLRGRGISATAGVYGVIATKAWRQLRRFPPNISITIPGEALHATAPEDPSTEDVATEDTAEGEAPSTSSRSGAHRFPAAAYEEEATRGSHLYRGDAPHEGDVTLPDIPFTVVTNTNPWTYAGALPIITNPEQSLDKALSLYALQDISGVGGLGALLHTVGVARRYLHGFDFHDREFRLDDVSTIHLSSVDPLPVQIDGESAPETTHLTVTSIPDCLDVIADPSDPFDDVIGEALENSLPL